MSEQAYRRADRVAKQIQQEISSILDQGLRDPRVGFVTVTGVRLSDDLRNARVYVSIYGSDKEREDSLTGLRDAAGYLKRELGKRVKLRYTPSLAFQHDESLEHAQRLESIFTAISEGATESPETAPAEVVPVHTPRSELAASAETLESQPVAKPKRKSRARRGRRRQSRRQ